MKILLIFISCLLTSSLNAQSDANNKIESIGFAYGVIAGQSEVFVQIEEYMNSKEYGKIVKLLKSDKSSDLFVGSLVCKILLEKNMISLTSKQEGRLYENLNSQLPLIIRSGCTCSLMVTIKDLFDGVDGCSFSADMTVWLSELFH